VADATAEWNDQIHKVTVSGMYGPVPEQYESLSQIKSYEYVLTNAEKQRQQLVVNRLTSYLEEYGPQFDAIVGYATSKTYRTVIEQAFSEYGDGVVLPKDPKMRALTEHFRTTNLEELSEHLNDVLSSTPPQ
jgi:predicted RNA-binding protein